MEMLCSDCFIILFSSPFVLTETNGASFQMIRKDYVCCCFLSELLIRKTTHFLTVSYCSFFRNLPLRNMHNPKIFFPVFFPVFSSLITEMYPFIYVFAQMRRVKGTYHMNILLHIMILYYMVYTYKTKYTCLFWGQLIFPQCCLCFWRVSLSCGLFAFQLKFCKILMIMNYLQNCQDL